MNLMRMLGAGTIAGATILTIFFSLPALAQEIRSSHEIRKGDTLFAVARKAKYDSVTRNQMIIAIYRANPQVSPGGHPTRLAIGTALSIPPHAALEAMETAEAHRL